ncbi:DUF488 domain-containing protein [Nesterenkonia aerolata]|uniref:DUF488 domain-containing protein n=1 Tax=Nesterenkonia aerolata TaxID=3074079 RepID=A0ABU2DSJ8_9MICC|nr:DUF488 domain-containing protein [Nesterenkonia sp. LY-0111]MDR8019486.1 DUF488 domain-containing protein [Nesterenkonia sp. LY-0111]
MSMTELLTVGHSTRELSEFLDMLGEAEVVTVVDVRRLPGSRRHPQFDAEPLAEALAEAGIGYRWEGALTGRRPVQRDVPPETNGFWTHRSFHNYADYALSQEFRDGLHRLHTDDGERPAVMCAEAVWWRCHRRIIADHLLAAGDEVLHLMGPGQLSPAELNPGARIDGATVTYPVVQPQLPTP